MFFTLFALITEYIFAMKVLKYLGLLLAFATALSCSNTNAIYAEIPVNDAVDAPPVSGQFSKHVLIEDYTGTWCGNCTRVAYGVEQVEAKTEKAVIIAIHNGNDPYHFADFLPLKNLISPDHDLELPQARLNRTIVWTDPDTNSQDAINLTSNNCGLGLAMQSTVNNGQINLDVKVKFAQNFSGLKLVVYVLENGLRYRQVNYSTYYNSVHNIQNFEHNHVLRATLTNLLGDPLNGSLFDQSVSRNFNVAIPTKVSDAANMSFVAFVTDANNNVINARASLPNEVQDFEENP